MNGNESMDIIGFIRELTQGLDIRVGMWCGGSLWTLGWNRCHMFVKDFQKEPQGLLKSVEPQTERIVTSFDRRMDLI